MLFVHLRFLLRALPSSIPQSSLPRPSTAASQLSTMQSTDLEKDTTGPPFHGQSSASNESCDDLEHGGESELRPLEGLQANKRKKNRGGKSVAQRGPTALPKNRGTGFEEFFADPPLTPQEYAEEQDEIYATDLPFEERIQSCIRRFRSRRRMNPEQMRYFDEYLFLGGIDTSNNPFLGQDERHLGTLTPVERRDATASVVVHEGSATHDRFYNGDSEHWSVDFRGVAAGFFSTSLILFTGGAEAGIDVAVGVVENFLRYVLHHNVCPEHEGDVKSALQLCTRAKLEWRQIIQLRRLLPGPFNLAATYLFSPPPAGGDWSCPIYSRPDAFDARKVFYSVCALIGADEALESIHCGGSKVTSEYACTLEVVEHDRLAKDTVALFKRLKVGDQNGNHVAPVGRALFKQAVIEDGWENPICDRVDEAGIWLYFEDATLAVLPIGVKMALTIVELNVGIHFVKAFSHLVPSFHTFLPQELMKHYKIPRESDRPAPSVHHPDAEEHQTACEAQED